MDTISAFVTQVVGGDTVKIQVTYQDPFNRHEYNLYEKVRIAGRDTPEGGTLASRLAKATLEKELLAKSIRLTVYSRDTDGRLVAEYSLS